MDTNINIHIKADTTQAASNVKGFAGTWTELKSKLDLVQEGAQIIGGVFKTAFDLTKEGAILKDTAASLERLAKMEGYAGDLASDLGAAFGGTVDDVDYMASAIRLLTGETGAYGKELANAAPQLATISRAIYKLNPTLGSTAEIFDAVTRAIETGNVRGLKPYGILVEETGSKQEILNEILQQGAGVIEQVGGNVEASGDSLAQFEMLIDDMKDTVATFLAEGLLPIADGFSTFNEAMRAQSQAAVENNLSWEEYLDTLGVAGPVIEKLDPLFGNLAQKRLDDAQATREQEAETARLMNAVTSATEVVVTHSNATGEWADTSFYAQQAQDAARKSVIATQQAMEEAETAVNNIATAFSGVGLAAYEAEVYTTLLKVATGQLSAEDAELILNLADVKQALTNGTVTLGEYFAAMLDGKITTEEYSALLGEQKQSLDETEAALLANTQGAKEYAAALNELDGKVVEVTVNTTYTGGGGAGSGGGGTVFDQRVGDQPAPVGEGQLSALDKERLATIMGTYGLSYDAALEALKKIGGASPRTVNRGGGAGAAPQGAGPTPGGFAVADGMGNTLYANNLTIYATNAALTSENGGDSFAMFSQKVGA